MACARPINKIPTPQQLGLPAKFDRWRPVQEEMLNVIVTSQQRTKVMCASTGVGKSPVAIAAALWSGKPTCIVTSTRSLQSQYSADFQDCGLVDLRGRANYKCDMRPDDPDYTCEDGMASRCPYRGSVACPCSAAEIAASSSSLVITNYSKWTSARRFGMGLDHIQQVVFDEGHDMPNALAAAMQTTINTREINDGLRVDFPPNVESLQVWREWASGVHGIAQQAMLAAQVRISVPDPKTAWVKHFTHMRNLTRRIAILKLMQPNDWVVEELANGEGFQFDPIRPGRYAEAALLLKVPSIIVVSATVRPKTMGMLGLPPNLYDFREFDSDFDPKRCPVYYLPVMRVDHRATSLDQLWLQLDRIAGKRRDRNGIVHTISYGRREDIMKCSHHALSMIWNDRGQPVADTIEYFKSVYPGAILVTPSVEAGYDFPGKSAEWQFICKIPFDGPSKIGKARQAEDHEYGPYNAMQRFVQTAGRIMRSKEDQGESFISDQHMSWFWPRWRHLAPTSFHKRVREMASLPAPPPRLI